jgi:hypothetical protein
MPGVACLPQLRHGAGDGRVAAGSVAVFITLRNLAIGLIRQAGYTEIAATIRLIKYDTAILGLKNPS